MKISRLRDRFATGFICSRFQDTYWSDEDFSRFTLPEPAKATFVREIPPGWTYGWHNVVCREYVVMLDGEAEFEVGSGERRVFLKGDVLLAEDLTGQGHRTRVLGKRVWRQMFVTLP